MPIEALDHDEILVEDSSIAAVLELAAAGLQCPDLGLRVGLAQELSMLGPLSVAMRHSTSIKDALECASRYLFVHAQGHSLDVVPDPQDINGVVGLRYSIGPGKQPFPQSADMTLLFLHRATAFLVGGPYGLRSVELPHGALAAPTTYEEAFGAPVRFGCPDALLRLPSSLMSRPLDEVDEMLRQLALAFLARQAPQPGAMTTSRVRNVLRQSLGTGSTDIAGIARVLAVHPRTLQRQLDAEGASFTEILDGVRRSVAREYLTTTDMPLLQISNLVGFSDPAVLSRCARRWWGKPPSQLRREARNLS